MKFSFNEFHLWHQLGLSLMAAGKVSSFLLMYQPRHAPRTHPSFTISAPETEPPECGFSPRFLVDANSDPKLAAVFKELHGNGVNGVTAPTL